MGSWVCPQEVPAPVKSKPSLGSAALPFRPCPCPSQTIVWILLGATTLCQMFPSSFFLPCLPSPMADFFFLFKYVNVNSWQVLGTAAASELLLLEAFVCLVAPPGTPNPDSRSHCSRCGWKRWSKELQIKPQKSPMEESKGER